MIGKTVSFLAGHKSMVYLLLILLTIVTLVITLFPVENMQEHSLHHYDKLGHFVLFFAWTFILGFSLIHRKSKFVSIFGIFLAGTLFGIAIEIAQHLMLIGRYASLMDIYANMAGSLTAVVLLWGIQTKYQSYLKPVLSKK